MEDFSLADVAAATRGNNGDWGGSSAWVLIILFALIFGWGRNGFGNGGSSDTVTEAGLCNAMNFNNLENAVGRLNDQLQNQNLTMADRIADLSGRLDSCCCTLQRQIDNFNYENALNIASINQNTTAQVQKILDAIQQNKIDAMQNQINQLSLAQALNGVVRYPNGYTYNAGDSPFCNGGSCNV